MLLFSLAPQKLWEILGWNCLALGLATLISHLHPKIRTQEKVKQAILSWWPVVFFAATSIYFGPALTVLVCAGVSVCLVFEGLRLLGLPEKNRKQYTSIGVILSLVGHACLFFDPKLAIIIPLAFTFLIIPTLHLVIIGGKDYFRLAGGTVWILNVSTTLFLFVGQIILNEQIPHPYGGQGLGVFFFTLVIVSDAFQYVGGKIFGKTKLIPDISPNKTIEGAAFGAVVCGVAGTVLGPVLLGTSLLGGFGMGVVTCILGLSGDLIISAWKRDAGVKDTGAVLPGQGGILDRCDSILYVAPWFWYLANYL